jgi:hypothetical protein
VKTGIIKWDNAILVTVYLAENVGILNIEEILDAYAQKYMFERNRLSMTIWDAIEDPRLSRPQIPLEHKSLVNYKRHFQPRKY